MSRAKKQRATRKVISRNYLKHRPKHEQIDADHLPAGDVDLDADLDESPDSPAAILERFCNALAVISTATAAMDAGQDRIIVKEIADDSDMIYALRRGLDDLKKVYNELDVAILKGDV